MKYIQYILFSSQNHHLFFCVSLNLNCNGSVGIDLTSLVFDEYICLSLENKNGFKGKNDFKPKKANNAWEDSEVSSFSDPENK